MEGVLTSKKLNQKKKVLVHLWYQVASLECHQVVTQAQLIKINLLWFHHMVKSQNSISSKEGCQVEVVIMEVGEILQRMVAITWRGHEDTDSMMSVSTKTSKDTEVTETVEAKVVWEETTAEDIGKGLLHPTSLAKIQAHTVNNTSNAVETVVEATEAVGKISIGTVTIEATINNPPMDRIVGLSVTGAEVEIENART